jgi:peptidoglycan/xylan/chitin deacetylase (PgdA/CDA1 family)
MNPPSNSVTICCYHAVTRVPPVLRDFCFIDESTFREQIRYLKRSYRVVSLSEAAQSIADRDIDGPLAVVTLDDGFFSNYDVAFPILEQEGCPATFFLATRFIDSTDTLWFCRVLEAVAGTERSWIERGGERFDLSELEARTHSCGELQRWLKQYPQPRLMDELRKLVDELGDDPDRPVGEDSPYRILTHKAILDMARSELVGFGAHTRSHAILSRLSPEERRREVETSLADVEHLSGRPATLFAYPNGRREDYDSAAVADLARCGVQAAVTTEPGLNDETTPLLELKRATIGPVPGHERFRARIAG